MSKDYARTGFWLRPIFRSLALIGSKFRHSCFPVLQCTFSYTGWRHCTPLQTLMLFLFLERKWNGRHRSTFKTRCRYWSTAAGNNHKIITRTSRFPSRKHTRIQVSPAMYLKHSSFWNIKQCRFAAGDRFFGTSFCFHLQGSTNASPLKTEPIICAETSLSSAKLRLLISQDYESPNNLNLKLWSKKQVWQLLITVIESCGMVAGTKKEEEAKLYLL